MDRTCRLIYKCLLLTVCLAAGMAACRIIITDKTTHQKLPRRELQQFSLFDPLADILNAQDQQEHSLMHTMSGHGTAGSISEALAAEPAGLDMAEAVLQDQHQVDPGNTPQQARLHSLSRSQALAKSRPQALTQSTTTQSTPPPVPPGQAGFEIEDAEEPDIMEGQGGRRNESSGGTGDCTGSHEANATLACLVRKLASLNAELEALSRKARPS